MGRGCWKLDVHDSALARKLGKFLSLGLCRAGSVGAARGEPSSGRRRHRARPRARGRAPCLHPGERLGLLLQAAAGRRAAGDRLPDPGRCHWLAQLLLRTADHSFAAVTDVTVAEVSARQLIDTLERVPRLAAALLWGASRDEAVVVEHLVNIGRRSALVRTAHFMVEMGCGCSWRAWARPMAMPARSISTCWPMRWGSPPSTSTGFCASSVSGGC